MTFSEETLMAYADNELDAQTRSAVETAMASDPEIARRVAQHKALRGKLRVVFDKVLDEPTPQRLVDAARGVPAVRREGNVIPLRRKNNTRRIWPQWAAIAATLILGIIIGQALLSHGLGAGPVIARNGQLLANGVLDHALSSQLSGQTEQTPVHIGVTFITSSGTYCRTFTLQDAAALAGLACRENEAWRVQVLAQTASQSQGSGTLRQATSEIPKTVLEAADAIRFGDPLDAHAEAAAREGEWPRQSPLPVTVDPAPSEPPSPRPR
jgi:hypothetical protein